MDSEFQYRLAKLREALAQAEAVGAQDIPVVVSAGCIHIMGDVPTQARRDATDAFVRRVPSGESMRDEVHVLAIDALGAAAAPGAPRPARTRPLRRGAQLAQRWRARRSTCRGATPAVAGGRPAKQAARRAARPPRLARTAEPALHPGLAAALVAPANHVRQRRAPARRAAEPVHLDRPGPRPAAAALAVGQARVDQPGASRTQSAGRQPHPSARFAAVVHRSRRPAFGTRPSARRRRRSALATALATAPTASRSRPPCRD
ncbi:MAG: BON domain-containing protein [Burkholderiales bacterium]|nr:BON domain-containing protein [Burkholderiales bacterium]